MINPRKSPLNGMVMSMAMASVMGGSPGRYPYSSQLERDFQTDPNMTKWDCKIPVHKMKKVRNFRVPVKE